MVVSPAMLKPEDLIGFKEMAKEELAQLNQLNTAMGLLQQRINGMLTVFCKLKGYPDNVNVDLNTGQLTPNKPAQTVESPVPAPNGVAQQVPEQVPSA